MEFYQKLILEMLKTKMIFREDNILIVAGGQKDKEAFLEHRFVNVTISNLQPHKGFKEYDPYKWCREDLEKLSFKNEEFDWVFVHAGLHHCASPHVGLCEMLRVSKKGVGVVESRDSYVDMLANKLGLTSSYEIEPCVLSNGLSGGLRNTHIPNFIYKWTEREVKKTTNTFLPQFKHKFHFFYGLNIPIARLSISKNVIMRISARLAKLILPIFIFFFKRQGNLFGFVIQKNITLQPWLKIVNNEIKFDMNYGLKNYNPDKYQN